MRIEIGMNIEPNLTQRLAHSALIMNVLGGGMTNPEISFNKFEDYYLLKIILPGIDGERLSVEVTNEKLFVFQNMTFDEVEIPYMIDQITLPEEVEYDNISAAFIKNKLEVFLPFSELTGGYSRDIDIRLS